MSRLIDADKLLKEIETKSKIPSIAKNLDTVNGLCGAVSIIYEQPTVEPCTKEDVISMLQNMQNEILSYISMSNGDYNDGLFECRDLIQREIDGLKGVEK